jgi:hypothetical protein
MGLIWKRDPLSTLLEGESSNAYMNLSEELQLNRYVSRLESLRVAAAFEIDLRGPLPSAIYGNIVESTGNMLNAFHAMNVIITKDPEVSEGETEILKWTIQERAQLCARISHLFQGGCCSLSFCFNATMTLLIGLVTVLASSMKLEYPLNDSLPSTEHARDRLLAKIFGFRKSPQRKNTSDEDFALLYAYGQSKSPLR